MIVYGLSFTSTDGLMLMWHYQILPRVLIPTINWHILRGGSLYLKNHQKIALEISKFVEIVGQWAPHESLEVGIYLKAIKTLDSFKLQFEDVCLFLFKRNLSVLLNLIALHYSIVRLHVTPSEVKRALINCQVSSRQVCVNWSKIGRWSYGFRLRDENCTRKLTLAELTTVKQEPVLAMLNRGAVHEVIRVQITSVKP